MSVMEKRQRAADSPADDQHTMQRVESSGAGRMGGGLGRRLLRMPIYYKLVIANGAIALIAVVVCAALVASAIRLDPAAELFGIIVPIVTAAVTIVVLINALVVRLALTPLRHLERAADQVRLGHDDARAMESAMSDAGMEQVVRAFNAMLESLSLYRRRLRALAIRALDAGEAERKRLSSDLHDNAAQSLAAILIQLRVARSGLAPEKAAQLAALGDQIAHLINDLRAMAQQLRPPALDILGLGAATLSHARSMSEKTGVRVDVRLDGALDGALSREAELAMYRVIQEALLNVVRHADATAARVEVRREPERVIAEVVDEGSGFDVARAFGNGALGLIGMSERASYVGGGVEIRSRPGAGTRVQITIPAKEAEHV